MTGGARIAAVATLALALALGLAGIASADIFGPIALVSEGSLGGAAPQQAEYAHDPAISGDGGYVVFDGSVGGVTGVYRRDLQTGSTEQVAGGDAELPSISESGEYVSFTTNEGKSLAAETNDRPLTATHAEAVNVYVRDMALAPGEPGAFTVASAADGSAQPLTYAGDTEHGAVAAGRSAISADGNEVAFVTTAPSDLLDPSRPTEPTTPAFQVAVRYLATQQTVLVTTAREGGGPVATTEGATPIGGVFHSANATFTAVPAYDEWRPPLPGASLSADGSTVAWLGEDIAAQAALLPEEAVSAQYAEPLWRRIAPGSETPTERVTGGSDPGNPVCAASGESQLPGTQQQSSADPCVGPFRLEPNAGTFRREESSAVENPVPRLSADGYEVAFIAQAAPIAAGADFGWPGSEVPADLYLVDMHPGLTRDQAITPVTELAGRTIEADIGGIEDFSVSPDGEQVAFTSRRTVFPLGSPAFVSTPAAEAGLNELYDADLSDGTLTRVTEGYAGGVSEQPHPHHAATATQDEYEKIAAGAQSPSFSNDGNLLAFASTASNLVFGDGNTPPSGPLDGSDAFLVERRVIGSLPTPQTISAVPQTPTEPSWRMGVTAQSQKDGSVALFVTVPGPGSLRAGAQSALRIKAAHARGRARRAGRVVSRAVASGSLNIAPGRELVELSLRLRHAYSALATQRGGLAGTVRVAFSAPGHPTLTQTVEVTFRRAARAAHHAKRASHHAGRRR
jgi:hypothetical protein